MEEISRGKPFLLFLRNLYDGNGVFPSQESDVNSLDEVHGKLLCLWSKEKAR